MFLLVFGGTKIGWGGGGGGMFLMGSLRKNLSTGQPMAAGYLFKSSLLKVCAPFIVKAISDYIHAVQSIILMDRLNKSLQTTLECLSHF